MNQTKNIKNADLPADGINWDLSEFYKNITDPQIEEDKKAVEGMAADFNKKYKGKIGISDISPEFLLNSFEDAEELWELSYKYTMYAHFLHDKDTGNEDISKFYQDAEEFFSKISTNLLWFGLARKKWDDKTFERLVASDLLKDYRHFLSHEREFLPFVLSEKEEVILSKFAPVGDSAFIRLYDQLDSQALYDVEVDGKMQKLSQSQLSPYLSYHKDRSVREKTAKSLTDGLEKNKKTHSFILNTLLLSSKIGDEVRGFEYPQHSTFLSYEVKPKTVKAMISATQENYGISEKFYEEKKKMLGYDKLFEWDRYNSIYPDIDKKYTWEEAKEIVLSAFKDFDEKFYEIAKMFFDNGWIDAQITPNKTGGAYCNYSTPKRHPYILMNFNGTLGDVTTLAHELGHGIHSYLSRDQKLAQFYPSTAVAEIASVFAESLVFDRLLDELDDDKLKINLLVAKLQGSFATVFRQAAFYLFEEELHSHRRNKGELGVSEIGNYYNKHLQPMFGDALELTEDHKIRWMVVSHFYHYDFYVFTYAFGELLALALYSKYKKDGKSFVKSYLKALSLGGSKDPYELTKLMGIDINDDSFWKEGFKTLKDYVVEFENIASNI